jgi:hypothetical protein
MVPIKEVGCLISGGTMTEEIPVHEVTVKHGLTMENPHSYLLDFLNNQAVLNTTDTEYFISDEHIHLCHHLEVLLQPPNGKA